VVGISVSCSSARTAGTLTAQCYNASTAGAIGPIATLDGTNTNHIQATGVYGAAGSTFNGNSVLDVNIVTNGWTPVIDNVLVTLWIAVDMS
jgi:hypothetical protein